MGMSIHAYTLFGAELELTRALTKTTRKGEG